MSKPTDKHVINAEIMILRMKRVRYRFVISLFFNLISYAPDRGDEFVLSLVLLHLAPETSYMYHNGVVGLIDLFIPDLFKDLVSGKYLSLI